MVHRHTDWGWQGPCVVYKIKSRGRSRECIPPSLMIIILVEPSEQPALEVRYLPLWPSTYVTGSLTCMMMASSEPLAAGACFSPPRPVGLWTYIWVRADFHVPGHSSTRDQISCAHIAVALIWMRLANVLLVEHFRVVGCAWHVGSRTCVSANFPCLRLLWWTKLDYDDICIALDGIHHPSSRMVMLTRVTCKYECMLKFITLHSKYMELKMLTPKYNNYENNSTYNNEPWGRDEGLAAL